MLRKNKFFLLLHDVASLQAVFSLQLFFQSDFVPTALQKVQIVLQNLNQLHQNLNRKTLLSLKWFPDSGIRRDGPIPWPAQSPDLTPLDSFFSGWIKNIVDSENITDIGHLKCRIAASIDTDASQRTEGDRLSFWCLSRNW